MNTNARSAKIINSSDYYLNKSISRLKIDGKQTPKKLYSANKPSTDKLSSNYVMLKKKDAVQKFEIQEQLMNSKLLEPLIEENIKKKDNKSKTKLKKLNQHPINNIEDNNIEKRSNLINLDDGQIQKVISKNNINKEDISADHDTQIEIQDQSGKISKTKFGRIKKFSFNQKDYTNEEEVNTLAESKYKGVSNTNEIISKILNNENKSKKTTNPSKSKSKISKVKNNPLNSKRKLDNFTTSDEEIIKNKRRKNR